jgi:hypothetical protein
MNCANHPDIPAVAYCRTCGKPLCANCTRSVQGVIYCEGCLADRLHGNQPPVTPPPNTSAGFVSSSAQSNTATSPNPTVAGILGGIPIGVGAVYTGQYAKGLVHLGIMVLLIVMVSMNEPWYMHLFFAACIAFFWVYQINDAVSSARAIQSGQPAPDPFGLGQTFSPNQKIDTSKIPIGAAVLIGLGVIFLLSTVMDFDIGDLWPLILIGLGLWLGATRLGLTGRNALTTTNPRMLMGPAVLLTLGTLFLLERMHGPGFHRTWPILLLVIGVIKLMGANQPNVNMQPPIQPPTVPSTSGPIEGEVQPPSSEVRNG